MCEHTKVKIETVSKDFLGDTFRFEAQVCEDCGSALWTEATGVQLAKWLSDAKLPRHKLTVQFALSDRAIEILGRLVNMFPGANESDVARALVSVYTDAVLPSPELNETIETVTEGEVFRSLDEGGRTNRRTVQFKPFAMLDICDWANIADVTPAKLVEESVLRMLAVTIETDRPMKIFWESTLKPKVQMVLKCAA